MITRVDRQVGSSEPLLYEGWYEFSEVGDTLIVRPSTPILGLFYNVSSLPVFDFSTEVEGEFEVSVRYSIDEGLNWSVPCFLSSLDFSQMGMKPNHYVLFEFIVVRTGAETAYFKSITLQVTDSYVAPSVPEFYEKNKNFLQLPYYNYTAISWALNVLDKLYKRGTVPTFVERGENLNWADEDYINLWWSFLYPMALRIAFANEFTDPLWNPTLLRRFLEQRGLIVGNVSGLDELYYLMTHFYDEVARRGTLSIFDTDRTPGSEDKVRGEFARLIDMKLDTDLFLGLINSYESGWWLGKSSPCNYENSDIYENYVLGYENSLKDIENYPIDDAQGEAIIQIDPDLHVLTVEPSSLVTAGIGWADEVDSKYLIPVSPSREYAIVATFKLTDTSVVNFGCLGYDSLGNQINLKTKAEGGSLSDSNYFVQATLPAGTYQLWGGIRVSGSPYRMPYDGFSQELQFAQGTSISQVVPVLKVESDSDWEISSFKFCFLRPKFIYLESILDKTYGILVKNNNLNFTERDVDKILKSKLLPIGINYTLTFE